MSRARRSGNRDVAYGKREVRKGFHFKSNYISKVVAFFIL